jgi:intracellular septation protein A
MSFLRAFKPITLDLAATILFVALFRLSGNIFFATAVAVVVALARVLWLRLRAEPVTPLLWLSMGLVVIFGTTTLVTHNEHFIMMKPTLVAFALAFFMLTTNWLEPYLPAIVSANVTEATVSRVSRAWAALQITLGIANAVAVLKLNDRAWGLFTTTVPPVAMLVACVATYAVFRIVVERKLRAQTI